MTTYQVVGQCAHVTTLAVDGGKRSELLYKGSILPESATEKEIAHLLSLNLIAEIGGEPLGTHEVGAVAGGDVRTGLDGNPVQSVEPGIGHPVDDEASRKVKADADLAERRAAAQAKLPADGSLPDGRAGKDVWVEFLVRDGAAYGDVKDADKAELIEMAKSRQK